MSFEISRQAANNSDEEMFVFFIYLISFAPVRRIFTSVFRKLFDYAPVRVSVILIIELLHYCDDTYI